MFTLRRQIACLICDRRIEVSVPLHSQVHAHKIEVPCSECQAKPLMVAAFDIRL